MGRHRSYRRGSHRGRGILRGVSRGPVLVTLAILVVAGLAVSWFLVRDRAARSDSDAAAGCLDGQSALPVTADPEIAEIVKVAAQRYNAAGPRVRDHCVSVTVTAQPAAEVAAALAAGKWEAARLGPQPGLWIPQSTVALRELPPALHAGPAVPLALSPIVLAVPAPVKIALEKAQTGWAELPRLQQGSLAEAGLPGWAGLRLTLPPGDLALTVAATVAAETAGTPTLAVEAAQSGKVVAAVSGLAVGAPKAESAAAALTMLTANQGPGGPIHAVPATAITLQRANSPLAAWQPAGARPAVEHPAVPLAGGWVDQVQKQTAVLFTEFLRKPEQAKLFGDAGYGLPPTGTGAGTPAPPLAAKPAFDAVLATLANPLIGVNSTVLLDISSSMAVREGPGTRLGNAAAALLSQVTTLPAGTGAGLWTYAKELTGGKSYVIESPTGPLTPAHRTELLARLQAIRATSTRPDHTYATVQAAYQAAVTGWQPARTNTVLLITDGPEDDSGQSGERITRAIAAAANGAKPVRIDVVAITGNTPSPTRTATLKALAQQTGGSFTTIASSDDAELGAALGRMLAAGR